MPTSFPFSEAKIRVLEPPCDDREYHKDTKCPGLQVCVTAAGAKTYYLVRRMEGKPTRYRLGTVEELSVDQARDAARVHLGKIAAGENPQQVRRVKCKEPTLGELWAHWRIYAENHKRPRSFEEDKRNWENHLERLAGRRLGTLRKTEVQALHAKIGRDSGIYAANRVLALLRAMLNKADELGYRGDNPAAGVKMFKETARDRFLQIGEMEAFFKALEAEEEVFRDFFLIALLTGARKSNCLSMRWADLDLMRGYWRIPESKGGQVVVVPLVAPAVAILEKRVKAVAGSEWVFPGHRRGKHLRNPQKAFARVLKASKLKNLRPHDLRRSLGSHMACANVSTTIIGGVLGHRPGSVATAIYARLSTDPQRAAMDAAISTMLTAGKQDKLLTVDAESKEVTSNE